MRAIALCCSSMTLAACVQADLPPQSHLDRLRVLAIRSEPPSPEAGSSVELDALVIDPVPERRLELRWALCLDPPGGDPSRCGETPEILALGSGPTSRFEAPGPGPQVAGVVLFVCAGGTITGDGLPFECEGSGAQGLLAVRRIALGSSAAGANPSIDAVRIDGGGFEPSEPRVTSRCPETSRCSPNTVSLHVSADAPAEELLTSWGVTAGSLSSSFASGFEPEVEWNRPPEPGLVMMAFVVRDGQGGVDWETRQFLVR